ncbi:MAG: rubrerythrin family protein [Ichthyobacteriaceae bacterium]|nr:rubrerythrin family protein [Ichthyobacteriaceae bacterium]
MKSLKGTETEKNLLKSFAGESQARMRYTYFAKQARKDGYEQIASIFEETAINEQAHAKRFFNFLEGGEVEITASYPAGKIGTTEENLKGSAMGENEEWTILYPEFSKIASEEGFKEISNAFKIIAGVEKDHEDRFTKLYNNLIEGTVFEKSEKVVWKCRKCGYSHEGKKAPKECPACQHPQSYFEISNTNY